MSEFLIEVRGTHDETDARPFDAITALLLSTLPPRGFTVSDSNIEFIAGAADLAEIPVPIDDLAPDVPESVLGFMLFDPRGLTASAVKTQVDDIDELSVLQAGAALEHLGKDRVGVIKHITNRIQAIIG